MFLPMFTVISQNVLCPIIDEVNGGKRLIV